MDTGYNHNDKMPAAALARAYHKEAANLARAYLKGDDTADSYVYELQCLQEAYQEKYDDLQAYYDELDGIALISQEDANNAAELFEIVEGHSTSLFEARRIIEKAFEASPGAEDIKIPGRESYKVSRELRFIEKEGKVPSDGYDIEKLVRAFDGERRAGDA